ncbi:MAG: DUF6636 domain-containing protein [Thermoleophilia bacterium]
MVKKRSKITVSFLAVVVSACALAALPGSASGATQIRFRSPDGNIACAMAGGSKGGMSFGFVSCVAKKMNWAPPKACPAGWGIGLIDTAGLPGANVTASASCSKGHLGDAATPLPKTVLAFGKKISVGGITCASSSKGVACIKKNGHGLSISQASYKLF